MERAVVAVQQKDGSGHFRSELELDVHGFRRMVLEHARPGVTIVGGCFGIGGALMLTPVLRGLKEEHARQILAEFATYYNEARCHASWGGGVPEHREVEMTGSLTATPYIGGLHHGYARAA